MVQNAWSKTLCICSRSASVVLVNNPAAHLSIGILHCTAPRIRAVAHHILLLASKLGYQTRVFDEAARRLGFELVMATDRCHVLEDPWGDHAVAVRFEEPEAAANEIA